MDPLMQQMMQRATQADGMFSKNQPPPPDRKPGWTFQGATPPPSSNLPGPGSPPPAPEPGMTPPSTPAPAVAQPPPNPVNRVPPQVQRYITGQKMQDAYRNGWQPNPILLKHLLARS